MALLLTPPEGMATGDGIIEEHEAGGFIPPRTDKPHMRRRRDDEALLVIGAL